MKTKFTLIIAFITGFLGIRAQGPDIINGNFADWTNVYTPVNWTTLDAMVGNALGATTGVEVGLARKDSVDVAPGSTYSLELISDSVALDAARGVIAGFASYGAGVLVGDTNPVNYGAPFFFRPDTLWFSYQFTTPTDDSVFGQVVLVKDTPVLLFEGFLDTTSTWQNIYLPLDQYYANNLAPDTLFLQFYASNPMHPVKGSTLHLDNFYFTYTTVLSETATSSGSDSICANDSVTLNAPTNEAYSYYQWFQNGSAVANANSSSYTVKDSGGYSVLIDSSGTPAYSNTITVTTVACVSGIETIAPGVSLDVYPNPVSSLLNVTSNKDLSGYRFQLFDVVGRLVSSQVLESDNSTVNVSILAGGTYIYKITDKENVAVAQSKFTVIR